MSSADSIVNWSIWEQEELHRQQEELKMSAIRPTRPSWTVNYYCNNCNDKGTVGLLQTDDWFYRFVDLMFNVPESWMIRTCPKCKGNPQPPERPPPPQGSHQRKS